ncbi:protein bric-a-brac 2-like [Chironomus tepperi]|uniref:protein bric-a-brac 2-like n=1 Tax=Chironomus tepperi TaxID=113505 RepID=UPI00391F7970
MPSNTPPSKNPSPLSISENRSQDCEEPPTDLSSKFTMKSNNDSNNNNNKSNNNPQQFCLRWNNYQTNLTCVFDQLLQSESFVDVTLACDGNQIKAHKIVLSACSPYFQSLFFDNPCQHPIIIMRDVKWPELKAIVEFMYKGEINVNQDQISPLLAIAEMLQIRGLAEVNSENATVGTSDTQIRPKQTPTVDLTTKSRSNTSTPVPTFDIEEQLQKQQEKSELRKAKITPRDWESLASMDALSNSQQQQQQQQQSQSSQQQQQAVKNQRKRRWPSGERSSAATSSPDNLESSSPLSINPATLSHPSQSPNNIPHFNLPTSLDSLALQQLSLHHPDDMEIKPGIAEMIREEERTKTKSNELNAKLLENSAWLGAAPSNISGKNFHFFNFWELSQSLINSCLSS